MIDASATVAIIVVNYGSHDLLARNFGGLNLADLQAQLIVVDNFSSHAERNRLGTLCESHGWRLVPNPNDGFGAGVNRGVAAALAQSAQTLVLANPDLELTGAAVRQLTSLIQAEPNTVVSPKIVRPNGKPWFVGGSLDMTTGAVATSRPVDMNLPTSWLSGACLAMSDDLWHRTGGFDPEYFLYWEDLDFSARCRAAGATLRVATDVHVVHEVGGTQGAGKSSVYTYYNCRNRLVYAAKWLDQQHQRAWRRATPSRSYEILMRGGRRSLLRWAAVSAALRGTWAGWRYLRGARHTRL